ncbi:hypothetical protein [Nocardia nova]|uniref:hypothetical protein n=1 Tax=Nocardia nova TaxID=37330 RepID=UPI0033F7BFC6
MELGPPEATALHTEGIHPVAQLLEASARRVRDSIPCFTSFGPVTPLDEFAQRVWGETFARERVPVECRLAVYVTDEELDDLSEAVVEDLGLNRDGFSSVVDRKVVVGLHPISLEDPENEFYRQFVGHHEEAVGSGT